MRCLGIPNTSHFYNVTSIGDAIACKMVNLFQLNNNILYITVTVWEKIKSTKNEDRWLADREVNIQISYLEISLSLCTQEEYEDTVGNVVNKKTYEDLRRQGLLQILLYTKIYSTVQHLYITMHVAHSYTSNTPYHVPVVF